MSMIDAIPLLAGAGADGYQISRSVRLRSSASAYFTRTPSVAGNRRTFTISAWVKKGRVDDTAAGVQASSLFGAGNTGNVAGFKFAMGDVVQGTNTQIFSSQETIHNVSNQFVWYGTERYRDSSAWYHVVVAFDTPQATASNRLKIWVNGQQIGAGNYTVALAQNQDLSWNNTVPQFIGASTTNSAPWLTYFDGLLAEVYSVDGQALTPSSFGETNAITGVWQPKRYVGTYGTNGFYLNFSDNSGVTATTIGKDYSGNGNNWTPSAGISITAGATYDSMLDVPTPYGDGGNGRGNYAVLNPLWKGSGAVITDGNLNNTPTTAVSAALITMPMSAGKWYSEISHTASNTSAVAMFFTADNLSAPSFTIGSTAQTGLWEWYDNGGGVYVTSDGIAFGSSIRSSVFRSAGTFQFALDCDSGKFWFGKDNVWYDSTGGTTGNPSTGANPTFTISTTRGPFNFGVGQNGGYVTMSLNSGQRPFTYTPPTGFKALNTQNLPTPTISNGAQYMAATTYAGSASTQVINSNMTALDFAWIKNRTTARSHVLVDTVRGGSPMLTLYSDLTAAEDNTSANYNPTSISGSSITLGGAKLGINNAGENFVMWGWNAGGSTVTNTSGTISAQVRANPTAGFSVVTYTGTGANATVGHGLNATPAMIIVKNRDSGAIGGAVYHTSMGATKYLKLFQTTTGSDNEATDNTAWNGGSPTFNSSVFSVGSLNRTNSSQQMVAYCFAAVAGYSAFGKYTGNGSNDGPFIYLGFRPRFVLIKSSTGAENWWLLDSARDPYNVASAYLHPNTSGAESSFATVDFLSNGFKLRYNGAAVNPSGATLIYAAFAENPFKLSLAR